MKTSVESRVPEEQLRAHVKLEKKNMHQGNSDGNSGAKKSTYRSLIAVENTTESRTEQIVMVTSAIIAG